MKTCKTCNGNGSINPDPCTTCLGKGTQIEIKNIEIKIPAGF